MTLVDLVLLEERRNAVSAEFDQQQEIKVQAEERMLQLKGQYDVYTDLINLSTPDPAATIDARPKKEKKNAK